MHRFYSYLCNQKLLTIISCFYLMLMPVCVYAGAENLDPWRWERPVKQTPQSIGIKAYKVDAVGAAVNDTKYATSVNLEKAAVREAMGRTMMNRVLGVAGWGVLGVAAVKELLDGIDWVLDQDAQSIYRNKLPDPNDGGFENYKCEYFNSAGKILLFHFNSGFYSRCPQVAVKHNVDYLTEAHRYENATYTFDKYKSDPPDFTKTGFIEFYVKITYQTGQVVRGTSQIQGQEDPDQTRDPPEREEMTPEIMADIMTGKNPDVVPDVWTGVEDVFVPETPLEQAGPLADIVKEQLNNNGKEQSEETEVKPDPVTGGSKLPNFCSWASSVCNFFKQFNDTPTQKDDTEIDIELPEPAPDVSISFGGTCPDSHHIPIKFWLVDTEMTLSYEWPCKLASIIYYPIIAGASYTAALIVAGIRSTED